MNPSKRDEQLRGSPYANSTRANLTALEEAAVLQAIAQGKEIEALKAQVAELEKDKDRLDWLEAQSDGSSCVVRQSTTGRGFRLHNTGEDSSHWPAARGTFRAAIDLAMKKGTHER